MPFFRLLKVLAKCINNFAKHFSTLGIAQKLQQSADVVLSNVKEKACEIKKKEETKNLGIEEVTASLARVALVAQHLWPGSQAHNVAVLVSSLFSSTAACNNHAESFCRTQRE
uniref:Uncharacterized protein n=1 Tax=Glossina palpalis gambiensis TaxID=67801 RepID=A0A1B0ALZ4_9MUSC